MVKHIKVTAVSRGGYKGDRLIHTDEVREVCTLGPQGNTDGAYSLIRTRAKDDEWIAVIETVEAISERLFDAAR